MDGNIVLAAGLLMFICVQSRSSEVVPDGVVYTEVKKTLVQGIQGVLTCRFYRDPVAVYWKKGSNPDDASPMLFWHEGQVSGPRYNDGSCDIDDNYSLVIKNVSLVDAGRYYCTISNYLGFLIDNYTDVFVADTAIETKPQVTLQVRPFLRGEVQCTVHIRPRTVSWIKKSTSSSDETLVIFENNGTVVKRSGVGYDKGMYNISEDYSLVISDVQVHNEGLYTCNVTDFDIGIAFQDDALVNVVAQPREPFPTILECLYDESDRSYCSIPAETDSTLTCQVSEYYPDINLIFLYGSKKVEIQETTERNNTDGTKNKTITIASRGSKELYTCVASNIPGTFFNRSTSALLHDREDVNTVVLVVVLILIAALALISLVTYVMWKKRHFYLATHVHDEQSEDGEQIKLRDPDADTSREKSMTPEEFKKIEEHVSDVLMQHCRKISDLIKRKSAPQVGKIIEENREALFDDHKMLTDWQANRKAGHNRREIQNALDTGYTTDNAWPSDMELKWISHHLTPESMEYVCKKLDVTCKSEDAREEGKRFDSLRKWRNKVVQESMEKKHKELVSALERSNLRGLMPPFRGPLVYKAELVDMAFQLLMHDLLPPAEALDISVTKLISYRPTFQASHLAIGTIDLLSKLLQSTASGPLAILEKGDRRSIFCNRIGKLQYRRVATNGMLIYDMSFGELCSISAEMKKISEEESTGQAGGQESTSGERNCSSREPSTPHDEEDETDIDHAESRLLEQLNGQKSELEKMLREYQTGPLVKVPKDLVDLKYVLQLTDQDIADGRSSSHPTTITDYMLFKIWKEKPRSSVFNYRAAIAHHLREIKMSSLADAVIAGNYVTEQTSREFIQNMVQGLKQDQLRSLVKLLNPSRRDEQWHTTTSFDVICQHIYEWVADWTKEMMSENFLTEALVRLTVSQKHLDLNDKLVEHGFLELAREIMIIEQQIK